MLLYTVVALAFIIMISVNIPCFILQLYLGHQLATYAILVLEYFMLATSAVAIFEKWGNNVIASSAEVCDDSVVGGGWYFSILVVERHLTEPISCFSCSKGEIFDNNEMWRTT